MTKTTETIYCPDCHRNWCWCNGVPTPIKTRTRTVVIEESTGAQILPRVGDERATVTAYAAQLCAHGDQRGKSQAYTDLSQSLRVVAIAEPAHTN